ncbi:MAG: peptidoglycan-binding protein [Candidatus Paceibacterota bacterium]
MNTPHIRGAIVSLLLLCALPALASAQTVSASGTIGQIYLQDRHWNWRTGGQWQAQIAALGSAAVMSLPMPVLFGVTLNTISPNFGDPRDGGARTHEGEDIMAVKGTPIVSPTAAVVVRTGVGAGEGNYVSTANPGGETFVYMHLDRFGEGVVPGTVLQQGSLIGYVGNTGNASGGAAHLHFEVHDSSGAPIDPFPRLTLEFTLPQKISFLNTILGQTSDPVALSQFLVTNFRTSFTLDASAGITLPPLITGALASVAASFPAGNVASLPAGDLELGSSGTAVIQLQTFLITKAAGPAAVRLASAGATGYFGSMTQAALMEFQTTNGITPANGYYGPSTRALVSASAAPAPIPTGGTVLALTRNLYIGVSGQDVLALQRHLNTHGFAVAASGAGSPGNETAYFGAATQAAVIRFQIAHSIAPAAGYVGELTRAALAA